MADGRRAPSATLQDVADAAGVSLATASRALNGSTRKVNEQYRARVLAAAARLDYKPNASAQAVARGRSNAVGVVVSDIADPYFSAVAAGLFRAAEAEGLIPTIAVTERRPEKELQLVGALRGQKPRGIIVVGSRFADAALTERLVDELRAFEAEGGRVVLVSQDGLPFDTVAFDNADAAARLAGRLVEAGYAEFAVLSGPPGLRTAQERAGGFLAELRRRGIDPTTVDVVPSDFTRDGGYAAAGELLGRTPRARLVFAVNDVMAVGAMARLREAGIELGAGIAVAGFDDIATLRDVTPPLSTVRLPLEEAGAEALRMLVAEPAEPAAPALSTLRGQVVMRASTPPVAPGPPHPAERLATGRRKGHSQESAEDSLQA